jgi:hypothetical protein
MVSVGRARALLTAGILLLVGAACAEAPDAGEEAAADTAAAAADTAEPQDPAAAARAALPGLFNIMVGLQGDAYRISRGLWTEQLDTIAAAARSIANHPQVTADELRVVQGILGDDIVAFRALDMQVHDLAVRLGEAAAAGDLEAVVATDAELRAGCVECHTQFRDRLRSGITR